MQVNPLSTFVAAVKLQLSPHASPGTARGFLHKSLSDVDFTALANTGYFYRYSILGKFQPTARQPPKNRMQRENHPPRAEPFSVQQPRRFQGMARLGSDRFPLHAAKDDANKGNPKFGVAGGSPACRHVLLCAAADGGCPSPVVSRGCCSRARHGFTFIKVLLGYSSTCI